MAQNTYVLTFASTHAAMASSKTLKSGGFDFWTIPTPREISAGCGIALRFQGEDYQDVIGCVFGDKRDSGQAALYLQVGDRGYQKKLDL